MLAPIVHCRKKKSLPFTPQQVEMDGEGLKDIFKGTYNKVLKTFGKNSSIILEEHWNLVCNREQPAQQNVQHLFLITISRQESLRLVVRVFEGRVAFIVLHMGTLEKVFD